MVLQVHDSLVVECHAGETEMVSSILRSAMEGSADISVPLEIQIKSGATFEEI